MLYGFLKIYVRIALFIFCRRIRVDRPAVLAEEGPLLLACNHPNSFLDAMILDTLFRRPLWSLARGDVFKRPGTARLLHKLRILPVYRTSEGPENLGANYQTFDACVEIFRQHGLVMIFSEGRCINEWHLRPLKKGTARLAFRAWEKGLAVRVIPIGINYNAFRRFGKNVFIHVGQAIDRDQFDLAAPDGVRNQAFNQVLKVALSALVTEIPGNDRVMQRRLLGVNRPFGLKVVFCVPALAGLLLHAPLYLPLRSIVGRRFGRSDHFDSIMLGSLMIAYPFYLALLAWLFQVVLTLTWPCMLLFLFLAPLSARAFVEVKSQVDAE